MTHSRSHVPIPPAALVEHAAFVRRVAWAILRNDVDADDVTQETLACGLRAGPESSQARASWLATVARNVARKLRRARTRADARDGAVARAPATGSALDAATSAETIRAVAEAVASLQEPLRTAVVLRHYDGLPPREIAARLGESVETVNKRLQRAHERLRAQLETERPGGARLRAMLANFARVPLDAGATGGVGAGVAIRGLAGGIAMTGASKVGLGAVAVAACALLGWAVARPHPDGAARDSVARGGGPSPSTPLADSSSAPPELAAGGTRVPVGPGTTATATAAAGDSSAPGAEPGLPVPPGAGSVAGSEVTHLDVQEQNRRMTAPDVVEVIVLGTQRLDGLSATLRSIDTLARTEVGLPSPDADGVFRFRDVRRGRFEVVVRSPGGLERSWPIPPAVPQDTAGNYRQVVAFGDAALAGRVFDRQGRPLASHPLSLGWVEPMGAGNLFASKTDAEGRYEISGLHSGSYQLWVRLPADEAGREDTRRVTRHLKAGERATLDIGVAEGGRRCRGIVRLASGTPAIPPLAISFELPTAQSGLSYAVGKVASDGRFDVVLDRGTYRAAIARCGTAERHEWQVTVGDDELTLDVALPGVRVTGTLEDRASRARPQGPWVLVRLQGLDPRGTFTWDSYVQADRVFHFDGVPPGRYRLSGRADDPNVTFDEELEITVPPDHDVVGLEIRTSRR